jgi:hypothetical protein
MTKGRLREIIQEELAGFALAEGGEEAESEPVAKDVQKVGAKMDTGPMDAVFATINNEDEFVGVMKLFLQKAAQHPSIKPNVVRRVLIDLAKQATAEAKA